jgi:hypothetical protein
VRQNNKSPTGDEEGALKDPKQRKSTGAIKEGITTDGGWTSGKNKCERSSRFSRKGADEEAEGKGMNLGKERMKCGKRRMD